MRIFENKPPPQSGPGLLLKKGGLFSGGYGTLVYIYTGINMEGGEHRDFPPLKLISKVYLEYWNMSDFPLLKNQQLIIQY